MKEGIREIYNILIRYKHRYCVKDGKLMYRGSEGPKLSIYHYELEGYWI
jgi:hypothetical protein